MLGMGAMAGICMARSGGDSMEAFAIYLVAVASLLSLAAAISALCTADTMLRQAQNHEKDS